MKEDYAVALESPIKDFPVGTLVRFVCAPPRWRGEDPRRPDNKLLNELAIIISEPMIDAHGWGGRFAVHFCKDNVTFHHFGDFMEPV